MRHMENSQYQTASADGRKVDKWAIFKDLTIARKVFDLSDRDLSVLNALLSFHPETELADTGNTVVFPSNASLAMRAHGMAESTLRRHLAALVRAGMILRQDSPNGKRYARRDRAGGLTVAFGFDLRPLIIRAGEIIEHAHHVRELEETLQQLREHVVLNLRDASKLAQYAKDEGVDCNILFEQIDTLKRMIRRKLSAADLNELNAQTLGILAQIEARILTITPQEMSGTDSQNERHKHEQYKNPIEKEITKTTATSDTTSESNLPENVSLTTVKSLCPDLELFTERSIMSWQDLFNAAAFVVPMLGIKTQLWHRAIAIMGHVSAATTIGFILQRCRDIRNPGGYLNSLIKQAERGRFSPTSMILALRNDDKGRAALC